MAANARMFSNLARSSARAASVPRRAPMSTWSGIQMGPPDAILGVTEAWKVGVPCAAAGSGLPPSRPPRETGE